MSLYLDAMVEVWLTLYPSVREGASSSSVDCESAFGRRMNRGEMGTLMGRRWKGVLGQDGQGRIMAVH